MVEFNSLLAQFGKRVGWDIELHGLSVSGKLDNKFNPLTSKEDIEDRRPRKPGTRKQGPSTASIINKVNKMGIKR